MGQVRKGGIAEQGSAYRTAQMRCWAQRGKNGRDEGLPDEGMPDAASSHPSHPAAGPQRRDAPHHSPFCPTPLTLPPVLNAEMSHTTTICRLWASKPTATSALPSGETLTHIIPEAWAVHEGGGGA